MKRFEMRRTVLSAAVLSAFLAGLCPSESITGPKRDPDSPALNISYAGVRSSSYGIRPFPTPKAWERAATTMTDLFQGSSPCLLWIVGVKHDERNCRLEFSGIPRQHDAIVFVEDDLHRPYLNHFDATGIKVFLQVEPGHAYVPTLIDLVLDRYKHHPCVIGFGVDVEWYREADHPGRGARVSDQKAQAWEKRVKYHNPDYRLFLKHWDRRWMPPRYRGDIIFVDDSQMFKNLDHLRQEFTQYWAEYFRPNTVFFQIGYPRDRSIWSRLAQPPQHIGLTIARDISQECGIFWVDFTLWEILAAGRYGRIDIDHGESQDVY
jgi:hypothetical protein